jgi:hypothetical protein
MSYVRSSVTHSIHRLRKDLRTYRERYGITDGEIPTDGIEVAVGRRETRMAYLSAQIEELQGEWDRLRSEVKGLERGLAAAMADELDRIRRRFREAWSPTPVLGFRIWFADDDGLHGARVTWTTPVMTAVCERRPHDHVEVPHTDGRCGRLGCGVYATKKARPAVVEHVPPGTRGWVGGLVEMSGKVVEHDEGYRAASARVIAAAAVGRDDVHRRSDPDGVAELFDDPMPVLGGSTRSGRSDSGDPRDLVCTFLEDEMQRRTTWTSANSNG